MTTVTPRLRLDRIVLASASPRRQSILVEMGVPFEIDPPIGAEPEPKNFPSVEQFVTHAAHRKALEIADRRRGAHWILAADTVAEVDGHVLGKPVDRADAERILRQLVGRRHRTWTGVCLLRSNDRLSLLAAQFSWVTFRSIGAERLQAYLDGGDWQGKAGAYGIQLADDPFVESLEGSYTNVMGLPVELVATMIRTAEGIDGVA
jgi:septum formation protein